MASGKLSLPGFCVIWALDSVQMWLTLDNLSLLDHTRLTKLSTEVVVYDLARYRTLGCLFGMRKSPCGITSVE
jgi:hypothetical protein